MPNGAVFFILLSTLACSRDLHAYADPVTGHGWLGWPLTAPGRLCAVSLDPSSERALRSLRRLEEGPDQPERSYELDVDEAAESENDEAVEDTDSELGQNWTDVDMTFGPQ